MKTGLAGCGRMGLPMAQALVKAGIQTVGFDIRKDADFAGVEMEFSPQKFALDLVVLFTVVRDEAETEALLFNEQKVLEGAKSLEYLVICSTLSPDYIRDLRKRIPTNLILIDAPMSGASIAAQEARLTFMIGGEQLYVDELMLHFAAMGESFHLMGGVGAGMTAKVLNNLVAAASTAVTRIALSWASHHDLSPEQLLEVMRSSSGQTWFGSNFDKIEFSKDGYSNDNSIGLLIKDVKAALTTAPEGSNTDLINALIENIRNLEPYSEG